MVVGALMAIRGWDERLRTLYRQANSTGHWANTYAMHDPDELFAETTQAYFNVQSHSPQPNGIHGPISTNKKLKSYHPALYELIKEVFPCDNTYLKRCKSTRQQEDAQHLFMDCDLDSKDCTDYHARCAQWATGGECSKNPNYMLTNCRRSCNVCEEKDDATPDCVDKHILCSHWAMHGSCQVTPDYMHDNCVRSCYIVDTSDSMLYSPCAVYTL
ncbi:secreted ShK toxin domain containing protein [Elysia marginata]|uniref:Secreted ShK toxin domain containing protein n=1 Tax=Elysia marginata TaxID=1093978 RepID=A0AAV4GPQ1_9GAST|nr:secreted ShK toxin domain containing protein [Elysia marginata]